MAYDIEGLLTDIETILKNNLNTKITAINTEKGDSISLAQISSNAYQYETDDQEANYNPFVLLFPYEMDSEGIGPATSQTISINVNIIHNDNGNDLYILKRMLRYQRCLKEVIQSNFRSIKYGSILRIESMPVMTWQKSGTSLKYKIASINIICTIA